MTKISQDLVQWIVADDKVAEKWRNIARRLGFSRYIPELDVGRPRDRKFGRNTRGDKHKLQTLMQLWEENKQESFTVKNLKSILASEGLHDMWMWVNLMTQPDTPMKDQMADAVYRNIPTSPNGSLSRTTTSPNSPYYYTSKSSNGSNGFPTSPYSNYFQTRGESPESSIYLSSVGSSSRPQSQLSDYYLAGESATVSPSSGVYQQSAATGHPGLASCPTTPLFSRRSVSPPPPVILTHGASTPSARRTPIAPRYRVGMSSGYERTSPSPQYGYYSPSYMSPGFLRNTASTSSLRSTHSAPGGNAKRNVFSTLYRPDLIKLSSPLYKKQADEQSRYDIEGRKNENGMKKGSNFSNGNHGSRTPKHHKLGNHGDENSTSSPKSAAHYQKDNPFSDDETSYITSRSLNTLQRPAVSRWWAPTNGAGRSVGVGNRQRERRQMSSEEEDRSYFSDNNIGKPVKRIDQGYTSEPDYSVLDDILQLCETTRNQFARYEDRSKPVNGADGIQASPSTTRNQQLSGQMTNDHLNGHGDTLRLQSKGMQQTEQDVSPKGTKDFDIKYCKSEETSDTSATFSPSPTQTRSQIVISTRGSNRLPVVTAPTLAQPSQKQLPLDHSTSQQLLPAGQTSQKLSQCQTSRQQLASPIFNQADYHFRPNSNAQVKPPGQGQVINGSHQAQDSVRHGKPHFNSSLAVAIDADTRNKGVAGSDNVHNGHDEIRNNQQDVDSFGKSTPMATSNIKITIEKRKRIHLDSLSGSPSSPAPSCRSTLDQKVNPQSPPTRGSVSSVAQHHVTSTSNHMTASPGSSRHSTTLTINSAPNNNSNARSQSPRPAAGRSKDAFNHNLLNDDPTEIDLLEGCDLQIPSPRKGGQNSYQEYFDNLISLIDEAARELSV